MQRKGKRSPRYEPEPLEKRELLAGVTIITHGFQLSGTIPAWVDQIAGDVARRIDPLSADPWQNITRYNMTIGNSGSPQVTSFTRSGPLPTESSTGESIVTVNWSSLAGLFPLVSNIPIADAAASALITHALTSFGGGRTLLDSPIHLIGHSRGASLVAEMARYFGTKGLWVEQISALDPHPLSNDFHSAGDTGGVYTVPLYDNIMYGDNFYRDEEDSLFNPGGRPVTGANNVNLTGIVTGTTASSHSETHAYYDGTIDRAASNDGDGITIQNSWYGNSLGRATSGYNASRIGRGPRSSSGIGQMFGGLGTRVANSIGFSTWYSDIGMLSLSGDVGGVISDGSNVSINYRYQAIHTSQPTTVSFFIDNNQNPYDGSTSLGAAQTVSPTGNSATLNNFAFSWPASLPTGVQYIHAKITNPDGLSRYACVPQPLFIDFDGAEIVTKQFTDNLGTHDPTAPGNWTPGGAPVIADHALMSGGTMNVSAGLGISSLNVTSGILNWANAPLPGNLRIAGNTTMNLAAPLTNAANIELLGGTLQMNGTYNQDSAGSLVVRLDGVNGAGSGQFAVSGTAALNGTLSLNRDSGFIITPYTPFTLLTYGSRTGSFSSINGADLGNGLVLAPTYGPTSVQLSAVLGGDANQDRYVDIRDFRIVMSNYLKPGLKTFSDGDFTLDGTVDGDDLGYLSRNWQQSIAAPAPVPAMSATLRRPATRIPLRMVDQVIT